MEPHIFLILREKFIQFGFKMKFLCGRIVKIVNPLLFLDDDVETRNAFRRIIYTVENVEKCINRLDLFDKLIVRQFFLICRDAGDFDAENKISKIAYDCCKKNNFLALGSLSRLSGAPTCSLGFQFTTMDFESCYETALEHNYIEIMMILVTIDKRRDRKKYKKYIRGPVYSEIESIYVEHMNY